MTLKLPDAEQLVSALASQIRQRNDSNTALIGIHTGGAWIAQKLQQELGLTTPIGLLDISFYRDDFARIGLHPQVKPSSIPFDVEGRRIVLVDDVLYTGRTVRAAMNELFDYGRPASIELAVLIDRGGRELPVFARYAGATLELAENQNIELKKDKEGRLSLHLNQV
ncbi:MAG TPA: bifunctional pyr operon transcriptional regulator/uracil phosphoribosyltransferase PyrR [Burkholderiales bacterium]|nr:bifunctional pyr operon transcriptional regulator/uracil phosphoribosyltransferase PyrR [Burkholderiales bacterium]